MKIQFKKNGNQHVISYIRDDQNNHWLIANDFLVLHDLSHYAIEKTLGYQHAFWGLIKSGIHPSDFEDREKRKQWMLSDEAWYAECMANLFLMELTQGEFQDFNVIFSSSLSTTNPEIPILNLSDEIINQIRIYYKQLIVSWRDLTNGQFITLEF